MISGFINLNKPSGVTSNKVLGILKHALREINVKEKVGHLGTLDPLASGVLPVALGRATRLFDYSLDKVKEYEADFILGANSPSLDTDTEVSYADVKDFTDEEIIGALQQGIGEISQIPPIFSAKSVNGVRAYKLARKGQEVSLSPKKVAIYSLDLISKIGNVVTVKIKCGGGTYVRAIGRDFAEKLGTTAVMSRLIRTGSGIFTSDNSIDLRDIENDPQVILRRMISIKDFLANVDKIEINQEEKRLLLNGIKIRVSDIFDGYKAVVFDEEIVGIGQLDDDKKMFMKTWLV